MVAASSWSGCLVAGVMVLPSWVVRWSLGLACVGSIGLTPRGGRTAPRRKCLVTCSGGRRGTGNMGKVTTGKRLRALRTGRTGESRFVGISRHKGFFAGFKGGFLCRCGGPNHCSLCGVPGRALMRRTGRGVRTTRRPRGRTIEERLTSAEICGGRHFGRQRIG